MNRRKSITVSIPAKIRVYRQGAWRTDFLSKSLKSRCDSPGKNIAKAFEVLWKKIDGSYRFQLKSMTALFLLNGQIYSVYGTMTKGRECIGWGQYL